MDPVILARALLIALTPVQLRKDELSRSPLPSEDVYWEFLRQEVRNDGLNFMKYEGYSEAATFLQNPGEYLRSHAFGEPSEDEAFKQLIKELKVVAANPPGIGG